MGKFSLLIAGFGAAALFGGVWLLSDLPASLDYLAAGSGQSITASSVAEQVKEPEPPKVTHLPTPKPVKALYMTQCAATSAALREHLLKLARETEINSIVVDLKDYSGTVAFPSATAVPGGIGCQVADFAELVKRMHDEGLYVIGRLTVFQDPLYTKTYPNLAVQSLSTGSPWKDRKGLSFVDVGARPFWDYTVALAREAHALGVDEINFDYIRYPSDGNMKDTSYTHSTGAKQEALEKFFAAVTEAVRKDLDPVPVLSADLFGMTATNYDDLNIGQVLERALPYFDYIAPMVYPSHYPNGFNGWKNPNEHAYDIIYYSMTKAAERATATTTLIAALPYDRIGTSTPAVYSKPSYSKYKIRPWLQDFDYPVPYTPEMVKAQIQATYDAGLDSWMMWDPANKYTASVYLPE